MVQNFCSKRSTDSTTQWLAVIAKLVLKWRQSKPLIWCTDTCRSQQWSSRFKCPTYKSKTSCRALLVDTGITAQMCFIHFHCSFSFSLCHNERLRKHRKDKVRMLLRFSFLSPPSPHLSVVCIYLIIFVLEIVLLNFGRWS